MADYLLDTNHASPLVALGHPLRERVLRRIDEGHTFAVCVPVLTETLFGITILPRAALNRGEWQRLRLAVPCYLLDERDAESAADLQLALRRRGRQLETVDSPIAAVTLRYGLILLTTDKDFQAVPGLPQENWLAH